MQGSARDIVPTAACRSRPRLASRSWLGFWKNCRPGRPFLVLAPVVRGQKGEYKDLFTDLAKAGFVPRPGEWPGGQPHRRPGARPADQASHRGRDRPAQSGSRIRLQFESARAGWLKRSSRPSREGKARSSSRPRGGPIGCCPRIMPAACVGGVWVRAAQPAVVLALIARKGCAWPATAWESAMTSTPNC